MTIRLKGVPTTMRVFMYEPKIDDLVGNQEPSVDDSQKLYDNLQIESITDKLSPIKATIVRALVAGDNFSQIGHDLHLKTNEIYKLKKELQNDLAYLLDGKRSVKLPFDDFINRIKVTGANMPLSQFIKVFVCDYEKCDCAVNTAIKNDIFNVWESNSKNVLFEDWQTKAVIVAGYLLRTLFLRNKVIGVDYYHNNRDFLITVIKNIKAMVRVSPILRYDLDTLKVDDDFMVKFGDGSCVRVFHQRGRKPINLGNFVIVDDGEDEINGDNSKIKEDKLLINTIYPTINPKFIRVNNKFV